MTCRLTHVHPELCPVPDVDVLVGASVVGVEVWPPQVGIKRNGTAMAVPVQRRFCSFASPPLSTF